MATIEVAKYKRKKSDIINNFKFQCQLSVETQYQTSFDFFQ